MRFCMSAMTLRMRPDVEHHRDEQEHERDDDLDQHDGEHRPRHRARAAAGRRASSVTHRRLSTRRSATGWPASIEQRRAERRRRRSPCTRCPAGTPASARTATTCEPRVEVTLTSAAGLDTDARPGRCGLTRSTGSAHEPLQQRRLRDQATIVVQRATHHEAQSVRVAGRRLGVAARVPVPLVQTPGVVGAGSRRPTSLGRPRRPSSRRLRRIVGSARRCALDLDRVPGGSRAVVGQDREVAGAQHELVAVLGERQHHAVAGPAAAARRRRRRTRARRARSRR